jgi:tyrosinase
MPEEGVLTRYDIWDLNLGNVAEFPVENPPGWDDISLYYARALQHMGWKQPTTPDADVANTWEYSEEPTSYYFQAAMHWTPKWPGIPPAPFRDYWNHCTHGPASAENYFLPWHRAYIYWYEVIIRSQVASLGGPEGWALPYWNYSYYDANDPNGPWPRATLPWVFTQAQLPDGSGNPLYLDTVRRGLQPTWPGETPPQTMYLETTTPYYDQAFGLTDFFGFNERLDGQPHGAVHVDVGTGDLSVSPTGWMQSTTTAAFDPIFWLHHSEVDRFWAAWIASGNHDPAGDASWLRAADDPDRPWRWNFWRDDDLDDKVVVYPGQILDPSNLADPFPYSYRYANLPQLPAPQPPGQQQRQRALALGTATPPPEPQPAASNAVLGAAENLELTTEPVSAAVPLAPEASSVLAQLTAAPERAPRVVLQVENVVAEGTPGNYEIYVNYPQANRETAGGVPHYVGLLAGFGADHHHGDDHTHGISASYDVTDLVRYLQDTGGWDPARATVTFVPAARPRPGRRLVTAPLRVGRVSFRSLPGS